MTEEKFDPQDENSNKITHDMFFRKHFSEPQAMNDLLSVILPQKLKNSMQLQKLSIKNGSYIDEKYRESCSDILVQVPATKSHHQDILIYILVEHKSYIDKMVPFQMLQYMMEIWKDLILERDNKRKFNKQLKRLTKLPLIVPLVFYHGKKPWPKHLDFVSVIEKCHAEHSEYFPHYRYALCDLNQYYQNFDIFTLQIKPILEALKVHTINDEATFVEALTTLKISVNKLPEPEKNRIFHSVLKYYINRLKNFSEAEFIRILKENEKVDEMGQKALNFLDKKYQEGLEQGLEKGLEKGKKLGIEEAKIKNAKQLLDILSDEIIAERIGLDLALVKKIRQECE